MAKNKITESDLAELCRKKGNPRAILWDLARKLGIPPSDVIKRRHGKTPPRPPKTVAELKRRNTIGSVLRGCREDTGMTMMDMAGKCGLSQAQISRIETGHQGLRLETIQKVASVLGVKVSWVLQEAEL